MPSGYCGIRELSNPVQVFCVIFSLILIVRRDNQRKFTSDVFIAPANHYKSTNSNYFNQLTFLSSVFNLLEM